MTKPCATTAEEIRDWAKVPDRLAVMLVSMAQREHVSVRKLRGDSREKRLVDMRRRFARFADEHGYSSGAIGRALNRDHTTILHHLGRVK